MWEKIKKMLSSSRFWLNVFLFSVIIYMPLSKLNENKPIGSISYSSYIQNIENNNIYRMVATDYSNKITVFTKTPIETIEYENAKIQRERYLNEDNLSWWESVKKDLNWFPSQEDIESLKNVYYNKSYVVLAPENVKNIFEKINLKDKNISVEVTTLSFFMRLISYLLTLVPTLIFFALFIYLATRMSEHSGLLSDVHTEANKNKTKVKLEDVAGIEENLKLEIIEIIDFIKNPEKYKKLNAKMPKGILMEGEPGVGKTMLAKAIANEAEVDFFYRSAADLENPYLGMSAKTVKELFKKARESKNAIIFIDEIDSIGNRSEKNTVSGSGLINALLTEMDGFNENENIVVIAATNHIEKLDKAILREGRFDRKISIPLPNVNGRKEILKVHLKDKKLSSDVNLDILAKLTTEYSGAALAGIVNEASIQAVREGSEKITQEHLMKARDKKIMGIPFKDFQQSEKQKEIVAYHEAGHAVLSYFLDKNAELYKVSILPRSGSLGVTVSVPLQENINYNKTELENMIQILFGGRICEEIFFNEISTGASNDIMRANDIADRMVKLWGMSHLGLINIDNTYDRKHSEDLLKKVDEEKQSIINKNYNVAKEFLTKNKSFVEAIAKELINKEEISFDEIKLILEKQPEDIKTKFLKFFK